MKSQSRSLMVIRTRIFRIGPWEMKICNKIIIDKTLTSKTVLEVIDPKKADFTVIFFVRHHLVALEGNRVQIYFHVSTSNYVPNESSWHEKTETIRFNDIWHKLVGKITLVLSFSGTSPYNFNLYFPEITSFHITRLISGVTLSKYYLS